MLLSIDYEKGPILNAISVYNLLDHSLGYDSGTKGFSQGPI